MRRFALTEDGRLECLNEEWISGVKGGEGGRGRVTLLWEPNSVFSDLGQLYFFGSAQPSCHYVVTRIADRAVNGGWLTRRYFDEWSVSPSAPAACFFRGDLFYAMRWVGNARVTEDTPVSIAFAGRGIENEPMGDFDDIGFIRDVGIRRSIADAQE